ncbi:hypothetical protein [Tenacibaculum finnmarkense]|uniref:hypothetical protein n=1 Tax=Tenacibaculum finnmarkense TaxID=2781243 RepID=UPI00187BBA73|nr:hypothetical protein [Tenacibaculum finnmarkense]MBE7646855.1 hypothetical protein [Tenacibaculum finnmarkense genomovar ulcerans]
MCAYDINNRYYESDIEKLGYPIQEISFIDEHELVYLDNYLFDCKGKLIKEYKYTIDNCCILTNEPFDNGVTFVVNDSTKEHDEKKYALMDFQGNIITAFFDGIDEGWVDDRFIAVEKNKKWGFIDKSGKQIIDFIFDWRAWDYEWINDSSIYEKVRIDREDSTFNVGLFTFTGLLALEPIYKTIEINSKFSYFENNQDRVSALINDEIFATDFDGNHYKWTHHSGLEKLEKDFKI